MSMASGTFERRIFAEFKRSVVGSSFLFQRLAQGGTDSSESPDDVERLVKTRERVKAYGEVFTPRRMVNQMLDLVSDDLESSPGFVDKTFFEPAAGDGNFLVAILRRKLEAIEKVFAAERWPSESLFALASIYAVELLEDNHELAQASVLNVFARFHERLGTAVDETTDLWRAARFLVHMNLLHGNTLTAQTHEGEDLEFSWWKRVDDLTVQRDPFTLSSLRYASAGAFDFTIYKTYKPCRIDQVHKGVSR